MKKINHTENKALRIIYIILLSIAGALVVLLIAGTITGLIRSRDAQPLLRFGSPAQTEQPQAQGDDIRIYSGLERLRITLADSSILVLSIAFPYSANDAAFTEELAAKVGDFRIIAADYFSTLPAVSMAAGNTVQIDEEAAKKEILGRFNGSLRLGRIEVLYFIDMMIFDAVN